MKRCLYLLICLFYIALSSCHLNVIDDMQGREAFDFPKSEKGEDYSVFYQYNKNVILLDDELYPFLTKVEFDTIVYISKAIDQKNKPAKGKILSCYFVTDLTPYGLGNKILSVSEAGDSYRCVTTSAPLDEIFKVLEVSAEIYVSAPDTIPEEASANVMKRSPEASSVTAKDVSPMKIGSPETFTLNLNNDFLSGTFSLGFIITANISLKDHKYEFAITPNIGFSGSIGVTKSLKTGYKKLFPKRGQWTWTTQAVPVGPIVLRPTGKLEMGYEGSVEGSITTDVSYRLAGKFGIADGKAIFENLSKSQNDIIKNISVNAKASIGPVLKIDFLIGIYTTNVAVGIDPCFRLIFDTDFKLNNENLFRDHPDLKVNLNGDVDAFFYAQFFGKEFAHAQTSLASLNLLSLSWPLLPALVKNSVQVKKRESSNSLIFDAEYELIGGLLNSFNLASRAFDISPSFRVYKGTEEIYHLIDAQEITGNGKQHFSYELTDLEQDVVYTGKPSLMFLNLGQMYDEDGVAFSTSSPVAAITDVVQTSASAGSFYSEHTGNTYNYEYKYYMNMYLIGADNCKEWGVASNCEYHKGEIKHYPIATLKDGLYRRYMSLWSTEKSSTWTNFPYIILKSNHQYQYFDSVTSAFSYGGASMAPSRGMNNDDHADTYCVVDSIVYLGPIE